MTRPAIKTEEEGIFQGLFNKILQDEENSDGIDLPKSEEAAKEMLLAMINSSSPAAQEAGRRLFILLFGNASLQEALLKPYQPLSTTDFSMVEKEIIAKILLEALKATTGFDPEMIQAVEAMLLVLYDIAEMGQEGGEIRQRLADAFDVTLNELGAFAQLYREFSNDNEEEVEMPDEEVPAADLTPAPTVPVPPLPAIPAVADEEAAIPVMIPAVAQGPAIVAPAPRVPIERAPAARVPAAPLPAQEMEEIFEVPQRQAPQREVFREAPIRETLIRETPRINRAAKIIGADVGAEMPSWEKFLRDRQEVPALSNAISRVLAKGRDEGEAFFRTVRVLSAIDQMAKLHHQPGYEPIKGTENVGEAVTVAHSWASKHKSIHDAEKPRFSPQHDSKKPKFIDIVSRNKPTTGGLTH